jgi:hypothetical protein
VPLLAARRPSAVLRLLAAFVVAATLAAGVWVAGGVITNNFRLSIALTTAWFAISAGVCLIVAVRVPGALKGNRGNQQYRIPRDVVVAGRSVLVWCRASSAPFGSARLT